MVSLVDHGAQQLSVMHNAALYIHTIALVHNIGPTNPDRQMESYSYDPDCKVTQVGKIIRIYSYLI